MPIRLASNRNAIIIKPQGFEMDAPRPFDGDRPISGASEDRLGFGSAAKHVAEAIAQLASPEGFVIGIEGNWGSGKSSFISLIVEAFKCTGNGPEVVQFSPWLISSRGGLLRELFGEIAKASLRIDAVDDHADGKTGFFRRVAGGLRSKRYGTRELRRRSLRALFDRFSGRLTAVSKVADIAAAFELPGAGVAGAAIRAGTEAVGSLTGSSSLEEDKEQIRKELSRLTRKIVVFVDDLDRLEPGEACEMLRLVRAVVDFPNIVYVLCYSREILAQHLTIALKVEKGEEYIEKIIQTTFSIPQPEAFDLRRMFRTELQDHYPEVFSDESPRGRQMRERLATVIDMDGGATLRTPRHVVRAMNVIRFHANPVLNQIDFADMIWLQLIRVRCMPLYRWIETYLTNLAAVAGGARVSEEGKVAELSSLVEIFEGTDQLKAQSHDDRLRSLRSILPGIKEEGPVAKKKWKIYDTLTDEATAELIADRRIGSHQHYRYYFALSNRLGALSDQQFGDFLRKAAEVPDEATEMFRDFAISSRPQGGVEAEALLDRLQGRGIDLIPKESIRGVVLAIASSIDTAAVMIGSGDLGRYWIWVEATRVLRNAMQRLSMEERQSLVAEMFGKGGALGWLTDVFRGESFDHGVHGDRPKPEEERLFSAAEFQQVAEAMIGRYRTLKSDDLRRVPQISNILYAWLQYEPDSKDEIRMKVAEWGRSDVDFMMLLEGMRSWRAVNGDVSYPLRKTDVELVMDFGEVEMRLESIAQKSSDKALADRATALRSAILVND